jgi:hypothetical protein
MLKRLELLIFRALRENKLQNSNPTKETVG